MISVAPAALSPGSRRSDDAVNRGRVVRIVVRNEQNSCLRTALVRQRTNYSRW
jgi:hypothetical protein